MNRERADRVGLDRAWKESGCMEEACMEEVRMEKTCIERLRGDAERIVKAAIAAVLPDAAVHTALTQLEEERRQAGLSPLGADGRLVVIAVGKAAWQMAAAAAEFYGADSPSQGRIHSGVVITKYHHGQGDIPNMICWEAGHPVPDENSFRGTQAAIDAVSGLTAADQVLLLLSGGGSALFEKPLTTDQELAHITRQLLASGASIVEINTIRKRLSGVKGGRFAMLCAPAHVYTVVLSDILGDPLDMIASGPAYPDSSTCRQALEIADRYHLTMEPDTCALLAQETPKALDNVTTYVIGSVRQLCAAAAGEASNLGYRPVLLTDQLDCQAREAGAFLGAIVRSHRETREAVAFIAGGETVVKVTGQGTGGRNQEIALAAAPYLCGISNGAVFSVGSDGTDGPTDAAGGYADSETAARLLRWTPQTGPLAGRTALTAADVLDANDAYHALQATDGLLITGPTGTNVNDVAVALLRPAQQGTAMDGRSPA